MDFMLSPGAQVQWCCPCSMQLQVRAGRLWLTTQGQWHDHFLHPGERLRLQAGQRVTLGAEGGRALWLRCDVAGPHAIDFEAHRRRAVHQREVVRRWWWRALQRRWRAVWRGCGRAPR